MFSYFYIMKTSGRLLVLMILGISALILSVILTMHALSMTGLAGCSAGSSCDQVTGSRWSLVLGFLPVSALSTGLYLAVIVSLIYMMFFDDTSIRKILTVLTSAIFTAAIWFIAIQHFAIKAFCPYCMSAHICGIVIYVLTCRMMLKEPGLSGRSFAVCSGIGAAAAILFIVFQVLTMPDYRSQTGRSEEPLPVPVAAESPHIGPADAPHTVALLYDYQCPHCRVIHNLLEEVVENFDGQVNFVLCPTPLSPECNPYIPAGKDRFPGSCTMAISALNLWKTSPEFFHEYDRWMMKDVRSVEECMDKVREIHGYEPDNETWTRVYLSQSLEIFARTTMNGQGGIPRLIYGESWVIPEADDPEGLTAIVEDLTGITSIR